MSSGKPPQPPVGGSPPPPGQPSLPGGPPAYGQQPSYGQPPTPPTPPHGRPAAAGSGFVLDLKRVRMADYVIAGGTLAYLVLGFLPWAEYTDYLGFDVDGLGFDPGFADNISGFTFSSLVGTSFLLFLLAAVWALLPAVTDLRLGLPRGWVTVGLCALGLLLTLVAWIQSLSYDFSIAPLLALLVAAAITVFALLSVLPELRNRPALPGNLANAAQWANRPAPEFGSGPQAARPSAPPPGQRGASGPYASPPPPSPGAPGSPPPTGPGSSADRPGPV